MVSLLWGPLSDEIMSCYIAVVTPGVANCNISYVIFKNIILKQKSTLNFDNFDTIVFHVLIKITPERQNYHKILVCLMIFAVYFFSTRNYLNIVRRLVRARQTGFRNNE
jgi:hypothetical protein